jgi:nucleoside-diphosphate-sugar epimerase
VRPATSEVERLVGDNSKLMTLTRWRSSHTLEQGLDETVDWFRNPENLARYKSWLYNV